MSSHLLDPSWLARLERLQLASRRAASGGQAGLRRAKQLGSSMEFADYRAYVPGDDLRQLDWNAYARSGKLFLKKYLDETQLHVNVYIDCSTSMCHGQSGKWERAVQLAAALGYLSLCHLDFVSVYAFDRQLVSSVRGLQGKGKASRLLSFLSELKPGGAGDLNQALRSPGAVSGKGGISIFLSDFLFESGYEQGLAFLQAAKQDVILVQILAEEERNPGYQGELRLLDSETWQAKEVSMTGAMMEQYRKSVQEYQEQLAAFAYGRGIAFLSVEAEQQVESIVFQVFRRAGIIR
ncbi:DUF58 domain-containing protein [Brevibacillus nitrificans]|uniref:DUF58 domain-containing protein n=1 Tax=Brevibacillus nitrificans TaxID=651560 RepID=UPI0028654949|nr:DUF58 domain-containing protein [Brevibacillus nitrificans]MDR7315614.1 uncharacterized protein (DUF58 family) [Brevibacillus nitrificans]